MAFTLERFVAVRPFLFHLTATGNLNRIMDTRVLQPTNDLLTIAGWRAPRTAPRRGPQLVEIDGQTVWIRDQRPLHAGNIAFEEGWDMPRFLALIDSHVFFWPGKEEGPVKAGINHFKRYAQDRPALIRVPTGALLDANPELEPLFCRFNSGAPRASHGRKSPRGSTTYVSEHALDGTVDHVKEALFCGAVKMPLTSQMASSYSGPWAQVFR